MYPYPMTKEEFIEKMKALGHDDDLINQDIETVEKVGKQGYEVEYHYKLAYNMRLGYFEIYGELAKPFPPWKHKRS